MRPMIAAIIFVVIAYLCGSVSSAIIICKLMNLPDPRTKGSGNPGANNVLRIAGKKPAILVLAGDAAKGLIPVLLARLFQVDGFMLGLVALATVVGHMFPIFFKFQGGKGVATGLGVILALSIPAAILALVVWIVVVVIFRYASLASMAAAASAPILILIFSHTSYFLPVLAITALIIWKHKSNIQNLRAGTEGKIKLSKK